MKIGVIELLQEKPAESWSYRLYHAQFSKQFVSITPQAIAVWCRQAGHQVHYATYYGQADPKSLLPDDLDVVFIGTYTPYCGLAYALAKLYRREKTLTVIGGAHAKSFPEDCLRYFDLVVKECNRTLVEDILKGRFDPPAVITSGKPLTEIPTVEAPSSPPSPLTRRSSTACSLPGRRWGAPSDRCCWLRSCAGRCRPQARSPRCLWVSR